MRVFIFIAFLVSFCIIRRLSTVCSSVLCVAFSNVIPFAETVSSSVTCIHNVSALDFFNVRLCCGMPSLQALNVHTPYDFFVPKCKTYTRERCDCWFGCRFCCRIYQVVVALVVVFVVAVVVVDFICYSFFLVPFSRSFVLCAVCTRNIKYLCSSYNSVSSE